MDAGHQAALDQLTGSVLACTELSPLMHEALTLVAQTLAVEYSAIWELLPDRRALIGRAGAGWKDGATAEAIVAVGPSSPLGSTVLGTTPTIIADWPSETRFDQPPFLREHGVISSLYVAIHGQEGPCGILSVDTSARRTFSNEEIHFLQAVANVLALAVERVQARQALDQRVEARTREIEQQLVAAAQERAVLEERQRLARDLHDSVTQALYGVTLHAQVARRLLAAGDAGLAADSLCALQETAQEALDEMRLLIFELRPPILEQVGLVAALQARLSAVEGRANLQTKLIADGTGALPALVEQALYRIAQEALNNALKHAHARRIMVQLRQTQPGVVLEISDDGVGFDPAVARATGGLGLCGIAERVAQLEGTFTLQSAPGDGTQLRVEIGL